MEVPEVGVPMECVLQASGLTRMVPRVVRSVGVPSSSAHLRPVTASVKDACLDGRGAFRQTQAGMMAYASHLLNQTPGFVLDVRFFGDPDAGEPRQHTSMHPDIIGRLLAHKCFRMWICETVDHILQAIGRGSSEVPGSTEIMLIY